MESAKQRLKEDFQQSQINQQTLEKRLKRHSKIMSTQSESKIPHTCFWNLSETFIGSSLSLLCLMRLVQQYYSITPIINVEAARLFLTKWPELKTKHAAPDQALLQYVLK